jgi:hypothetical protein
MRMRAGTGRIVVMMLVTASMAKCSDRAAPDTTTSTVPVTTTTVDPGLGGEHASGIEGLPVPASASSATGTGTCTGARDCREEYWTVSGTSADAVRAWYAARLSQTRPWRDWEPCSSDPADNPTASTIYQWHKPKVALNVILSELSPTIHLRTTRTDLPCQ